MAGEDVGYLPSPSALRRMCGPLKSLMADVYWIRTIQYYGGTKRRMMAQPSDAAPPASLPAVDRAEYGQLYPLLDITTSLDPRFNIAYRFGAVFLAETFP